MLFISVAICIWVAWCFKNDSFPFLWPIKFVRVVVSVFFGTFYIASINIFLTASECVPKHGTWIHHIWEEGEAVEGIGYEFHGASEQPLSNL